MHSTTEKMSEASAPVGTANGAGVPRKGDRFDCTSCGMQIEVTADCHCEKPDHVHFACCGQPMQKA